MEDSFGTRLKNAWNVFLNRDSPNVFRNVDIGPGDAYRPDRNRVYRGTEKSLITSVYTRMAVDAAQLGVRHVRLDENKRYKEDMDSDLNSCLTLEANLDQTGRELFEDIYFSMFEEGCVAVVPVDTDYNPLDTESYKIYSLRCGKILEWHPRHVKVQLYDARTGKQKEVLVEKASTAIIQNPFYSVMNEPSSTVQRLIRKLNILDAIDEQSGSGKLDLIIQLPYVIKTDARRQQAEQRRQDIERQLSGSKYGIAYTDGTEHITQLNRAVENNLMKQIEYLTGLMYSQLGISQEVMDGTADDKVMLNYNNRTLEPIVATVTNEMKRKFLTKTARSQGQTIMFFSDPFKLVTVDAMADAADKFTRNEIMSTNEVRQIIGMKPSDDPRADELRNKNLNEPEGERETTPVSDPVAAGKTAVGGILQNEQKS